MEGSSSRFPSRRLEAVFRQMKSTASRDSQNFSLQIPNRHLKLIRAMSVFCVPTGDGEHKVTTDMAVGFTASGALLGLATIVDIVAWKIHCRRTVES